MKSPFMCACDICSPERLGIKVGKVKKSIDKAASSQTRHVIL